MGFYFMLQDKAYNKDDEIIKATSFEVISTLRDVLKTSSLWRDHVQTYTKVWTLLCMCLLELGERVVGAVLSLLCLCA